jgi:hypothetical protein
MHLDILTFVIWFPVIKDQEIMNAQTSKKTHTKGIIKKIN